MMKYLTTLFLILLLAGCGKSSSPNEAKKTPALDTFSSAFNAERKQAMMDYGISGITKDTDLITVDCMVFNQASKQALPSTLGKLSSLQQALEIKLLIGCSDNIPLSMAQYETTRRLLKTLYDKEMQSKTQSEQVLIGQSQAGMFVQNQINDVASEYLSCRANLGKQKRVSSMGRLDLEDSANKCKPDIMSTRYYERNCQQAWQTAQSQSLARGERDDLSYLSEMVARYRAMFLSCYPQAPQDYLAFHPKVPTHLLSERATRFRIPVDKVMQCTIQKTYEERSKGRSGSPTKIYYDCTNDTELTHLYSRRFMMPDIYNSNMLQGKGLHGDWLFNPKNANQEPLRWDLGDCEKQMAGWMVQNGYNLVQPEALKFYCKRKNSKQ